jgi:CheY-like chemotaxis protein
VEDTGPGISPPDREKIFDSFVQGEGATGVRGGTGLGLTISRRYAKLLGGELDLVKTEPGKGSVFRCEIPFEVSVVEPAAVEPGLLVTHAVMKDGRAPRVLVVDDESINRRLLVRVLDMLGFETKEAASGEEAVSQFAAWPPDLVFMDIRMPHMDGIMAAKLIREQPHGKACPVIALTASAFECEKDRILTAGLSGYVRKPFKLDELLVLIKQHIQVDYTYAARTREPPAAGDDAALVDAAGWPSELRESLCKAAREADMAELDALLARLPETPATKAVRRLLDTYDYAALVAALAAPARGGSRLAHDGAGHTTKGNGYNDDG